MNRNLKKAALAAGFVFFSSGAMADADIAIGTGSLSTTANVDFCVIVPQVLIFGVGPVGDTIAKIEWTLSVDSANPATAFAGATYNGTSTPEFTDPLPFSTTPSTMITDGGNGSSVNGATATLPVYIFSNAGDVNITSVAAGSDGTGTVDFLDNSTSSTTVPMSEIAVAASAGSPAHPGATAVTTTTVATTAATNGVVNTDGTWEYTYTPATIPAAGTYEGRITYTAVSP